jgi:hypothetical protein
VAWLIEQLELRDVELAQCDSTIRSLEFKNQKLTHELAYYRCIRFGAKTEAMSAEQLQLFEDDLTEEIAAVEADLSPSADSPPKPRRKAGRQPLPDHLPRETHIYKPDSCRCGQCGAHLVKIGEDVTEKRNIIPAQFFVERHFYPKYACRACETITVKPSTPRHHRWRYGRPWPFGLACWSGWRSANMSITCLSIG